MKKRSHKNNPRRTTAPERAHKWASAAGWCDLDNGGHAYDCRAIAHLLEAHARATLARERRRDRSGK